MSSWWERDLLLCKCFNFVPNNVDPSRETEGLKYSTDMCMMRTYRSSDAFNSKTPSLYASPRS